MAQAMFPSRKIYVGNATGTLPTESAISIAIMPSIRGTSRRCPNSWKRRKTLPSPTPLPITIPTRANLSSRHLVVEQWQSSYRKVVPMDGQVFVMRRWIGSMSEFYPTVRLWVWMERISVIICPTRKGVGTALIWYVLQGAQQKRVHVDIFLISLY